MSMSTRWRIITTATLLSAATLASCDDTSDRGPADIGAVEAGAADLLPLGDLGRNAGQDRDVLAPADLGSDSGETTGAATCPATLPAGWIFCEDFESKTPLADVFFEYVDDEGDFTVTNSEAASGTHSMQVIWQSGEVAAGRFNIAFGRNPIIYGGRPHYSPNDDFDEVYWRMRVKHQSGWPDVGPAKLSRATAFAKSNWGQAMIAHLWSKGVVLIGDPASCVSGSTVSCNTYNDFANLDWLGQLPGTTPIFSAADSGTWRCVEGHVELNTPGQVDGVFEFWIDGNLENSSSSLDWRGSWDAYGINLVSIENYWNDGAVQELRRWIDDVAIATTRIGCD